MKAYPAIWISLAMQTGVEDVLQEIECPIALSPSYAVLRAESLVDLPASAR